MGEIVGAVMSTTSAFLMGRKLYGEWSEYWPQQGPEVPFSEFVNGIPKYVVSSTTPHREPEQCSGALRRPLLARSQPRGQPIWAMDLDGHAD